MKDLCFSTFFDLVSVYMQDNLLRVWYEGLFRIAGRLQKTERMTKLLFPFLFFFIFNVSFSSSM